MTSESHLLRYVRLQTRRASAAHRKDDHVSGDTQKQASAACRRWQGHPEPTEFRSVIAFGIARVVSDDEEKRHGLKLLAEKYSPGLDEAADAEIEGEWKHTCVVAIDLDYFSTKEAIELVRARGAEHAAEEDSEA